MNPLIDTVEPDARLYVENNHTFGVTRSLYGTEVAKLSLGDHAFYSRPKVESLLAECRREARKEALLELAMQHGAGTGLRRLIDPDDLRRMAEGENDEIHN